VRALLPKLLLPGLLLLALVPSGATAKDEPGVHVDPDSPSGKEYVIPLEGVRRDASSGGAAGDTSSGGSSGGGAAAAPLFGEGISSEGSRGTGSSGGGKSGKKSAKKDSLAERTARSTLASAPGGGSGDSATAETGAIALAVLLAGGALGLLLRRVLRS
jgi:hypothetical protein